MKVQSSALTVKSIEVLGGNVYIRKNIVRIDNDGDEGFHGWEYDEIVLSLEQYLSAIETIGQQVTNLMLEVM